jgi:signal transduction histidine kinase
MIDKDIDPGYLKTLTLLFVEDEEEIREHLGRFLSYRVGTLLTAANGMEGLEKFRSARPHLVITDIMMPEKDGLAMAQEIRQLDREIPIIVCTAFEQTGYLLRAIEIGIDKYVTKPIDTEKLYQSLLECAHRVRIEKQQLQVASQLRQADKMEAVGLLAGGMAHDFNNLLQVIIGGISLCRMRLEPGSEADELLEPAERSAEQARHLGMQLLALAKGGFRAREAMEIAPLIIDVVSSVLAGTAIQCEFDLQQDMPVVVADARQIAQVFSQLVTNAVEAMPEGGRVRIGGHVSHISMEDAPPLAGEDYLHVTVHDSGPGIPEEHLSKIFNPYFTTKEVGSRKGQGLGLAVCQAVIRKHGGVITAESSPGEGTTFHVWLPVTRPV